MNKNTKIWLKYVAGAAISLFLLWTIYGQVTKQLAGINAGAWKQTGNNAWLCLCIALMFVNTSLEALKWYLLTNSVEPVSYLRAFSSYLAGMAISIVTPNRIGEYPGRILYLGRSNTFRYINVAVLAVMAQLFSLYFFGAIGLVYYNIAFPALAPKLALTLCIIVNIFLTIGYWKFEIWLPAFDRIRWLRRFAIYGRLLNRMTNKKQLTVLALSMFRYIIFTAQYLILLRWMNVNMPVAEGFCMAAVISWVMAVVPALALTEVGVRGQVSVYIFQHFSPNTMGIFAATAGIWFLNIVIPSVAGSILMWRAKLLS